VSHNFPVIDLEAVRQPQVSIGVRREIAHHVASACEEIGFFGVTGHGVPGVVIADLVAESYAFFDLPLAEKLAVRRPRPEQNPATSRRAKSVWPGCAVTKHRRI
jgi:isopenicillin N synthase-like dioxygenase